MSMEHTQGRLKSFEVYADPELRCADGFLVTVVHAGAKHAGKEVANARRIVACWNVFEGMTTEQIAVLAQHAETVRALVAPLLERAAPTPRRAVCTPGPCVYDVKDPQPEAPHQLKCSKCGDTIPF